MPIPPFGSPPGLQIPTFGTLGSRPANPSYAGQTYFATDDAGGTLYINNAGSWQEVGKRGELGSATNTGSFSTASTTFVAITSLTTTVTVGARPVKISFSGNMRMVSVTQGQDVTIAISRDGAPGTGTQITEQVIASQVSLATAGDWYNPNFWGRDNPSAGSHTYAMYVETQSGTVVFQGGATFPLQLIVEEI